MTDPAEAYERIQAEVGRVLVGNEEVVERLTVALLTRGHVLLEGVPGVAKTTTASLFARVTGLESRRIQMTPDILPADITGTHVYRDATGEFELQRGPIFTNIAVADEINRATPKTQSALLEAMQEFSVTIEGDTVELPSPFMVVATQNPIEMEGTFELPEAQRDRFTFKLIVDTPSRDNERQLLDRFDDDATLGPADATPVLSPADVASLRETVADVYVADPLKNYILDVVRAVRNHDQIDVGASPRAGLTFLHTGKARAAIHGREYVTPADVKALAKPILRHRLVLDTEATLSEFTAADIIDDVLSSVATPSELSVNSAPPAE